MPYTIRKQKCKQSDGDSGSYVLSYTTKKGKKVKNCHTSKKNAQGQIAAIEGPREASQSIADLMPTIPDIKIKRQSPESKSKDVGNLNALIEAVITRLMEIQDGNNSR